MKDDDFICLGYIAKTNNMTRLILAKLDSEDNYVLMGHSEEARREALLNLICF